MARLHQFQRHSRDGLVFGRRESAPVTGPASRGVEPATASQRPDGGFAPNPGVAPVGKDRTGTTSSVAQGRPVVDLTAVEVAMDHGDFDLATTLLDRVIDTHPDAPEALALMGLLLELRGLDHAAYHEYRRALAVDPDNVDAQANMRRYCARFGLDPDDPRINPAAGR